jgi:hypothetical protein
LAAAAWVRAAVSSREPDAWAAPADALLRVPPLTAWDRRDAAAEAAVSVGAAAAAAAAAADASAADAGPAAAASAEAAAAPCAAAPAPGGPPSKP